MTERSFVQISLTSISRRLSSLHKTLENLLCQDYEAFDVSLYLSPDPYLLDDGVSVLSDEIDELKRRWPDRLRVAYTMNSGPYRKLLPALARAGLSDTLIATADDDTLYPDDWLSCLVDRYERHRCIIAYRGHEILFRDGGFQPYRRWMTHKSQASSGMRLLPTGKDGVLYNSRFFHPAVHNLTEARRIAPTTDDLWWKWHSAAVGVPVHLLHPDYTTGTLPEVSWGGSLYDNFNMAGENDRVIARLEEYGRDRLGFSFLEPA
ncbi:MAG: glycosyltransferase family A protein [Pseudomonadota bacterium]